MVYLFIYQWFVWFIVAFCRPILFMACHSAFKIKVNVESIEVQVTKNNSLIFGRLFGIVYGWCLCDFFQTFMQYRPIDIGRREPLNFNSRKLFSIING